MDYAEIYEKEQEEKMVMEKEEEFKDEDSAIQQRKDHANHWN